MDKKPGRFNAREGNTLEVGTEVYKNLIDHMLAYHIAIMERKTRSCLQCPTMCPSVIGDLRENPYTSAYKDKKWIPRKLLPEYLMRKLRSNERIGTRIPIAEEERYRREGEVTEAEIRRAGGSIRRAVLARAHRRAIRARRLRLDRYGDSAIRDPYGEDDAGDGGLFADVSGRVWDSRDASGPGPLVPDYGNLQVRYPGAFGPRGRGTSVIPSGDDPIPRGRIDILSFIDPTNRARVAGFEAESREEEEFQRAQPEDLHEDAPVVVPAPAGVGGEPVPAEPAAPEPAPAPVPGISGVDVSGGNDPAIPSTPVQPPRSVPLMVPGTGLPAVQPAPEVEPEVVPYAPHPIPQDLGADVPEPPHIDWTLGARPPLPDVERDVSLGGVEPIILHIQQRFLQLHSYLQAQHNARVFIPYREEGLEEGFPQTSLGVGYSRGQFVDQWAGAAGVRNVQWIRMLTEINTSIEGLQAVFNVEGEPPRVLRAENVGQYLDDARTIEMAEEDAPSLINIHVWGANQGNWDVGDGNPIEGGGMAARFATQAPGVFGIVTTPVGLVDVRTLEIRGDDPIVIPHVPDEGGGPPGGGPRGDSWSPPRLPSPPRGPSPPRPPSPAAEGLAVRLLRTLNNMDLAQVQLYSYRAPPKSAPTRSLRAWPSVKLGMVRRFLTDFPDLVPEYIDESVRLEFVDALFASSWRPARERTARPGSRQAVLVNNIRGWRSRIRVVCGRAKFREMLRDVNVDLEAMDRVSGLAPARSVSPTPSRRSPSPTPSVISESGSEYVPSREPSADPGGRVRPGVTGLLAEEVPMVRNIPRNLEIDMDRNPELPGPTYSQGPRGARKRTKAHRDVVESDDDQKSAVVGEADNIARRLWDWMDEMDDVATYDRLSDDDQLADLYEATLAGIESGNFEFNRHDPRVIEAMENFSVNDQLSIIKEAAFHMRNDETEENFRGLMKRFIKKLKAEAGEEGEGDDGGDKGDDDDDGKGPKKDGGDDQDPKRSRTRSPEPDRGRSISSGYLLSPPDSPARPQRRPREDIVPARPQESPAVPLVRIPEERAIIDLTDVPDVDGRWEHLIDHPVIVPDDTRSDLEKRAANTDRLRRAKALYALLVSRPATSNMTPVRTTVYIDTWGSNIPINMQQYADIIQQVVVPASNVRLSAMFDVITEAQTAYQALDAARRNPRLTEWRVNIANVLSTFMAHLTPDAREHFEDDPLTMLFKGAKWREGGGSPESALHSQFARRKNAPNYATLQELRRLIPQTDPEAGRAQHMVSRFWNDELVRIVFAGGGEDIEKAERERHILQATANRFVWAGSGVSRFGGQAKRILDRLIARFIPRGAFVAPAPLGGAVRGERVGGVKTEPPDEDRRTVLSSSASPSPQPEPRRGARKRKPPAIRAMEASFVRESGMSRSERYKGRTNQIRAELKEMRIALSKYKRAGKTGQVLKDLEKQIRERQIELAARIKKMADRPSVSPSPDPPKKKRAKRPALHPVLPKKRYNPWEKKKKKLGQLKPAPKARSPRVPHNLEELRALLAKKERLLKLYTKRLRGNPNKQTKANFTKYVTRLPGEILALQREIARRKDIREKEARKTAKEKKKKEDEGRKS